jgi:NhaA family Na+:H+ antiporter
MRQDVTRLRAGQTVGEALEWLRKNPPAGRIIYFYVVDENDGLRGVVPTRRLVLSPPQTPLADIMVAQPVSLPASATVLDACEFFILHRLLAFPVVDDRNRLLGVVDIDLYTNELDQFEQGAAIRKRVRRLMEPLIRFFHIEASAGVVLLAFTVTALIVANSPWGRAFNDFWHTSIGFVVGDVIGDVSLHMPLLEWINDGLMALFFLVVGLEIKRELVVGELTDLRKALLPIIAAAGGMVVPAVVYLFVLGDHPGRHGWGVPTATDIAFVVGFLTLLGSRVPPGLKALLLTLAIADDIGAVLVIAFVYTSKFALGPLVLAAVGLLIFWALLTMGIRSVTVFIILGVAIWLGFLLSGVHPTVAGVLLGLLIPVSASPRRRALFDVVADLFRQARGASGKAAEVEAVEPVSPAEQLEEALHPWVAFVIMPVFALANAGVRISLDELTTPLALADATGLIVGKPVGILLFSWVSVRLGLTRLPDRVDWKAMVGASCLAGIGFTMSLFIASLALERERNLLEDAKIGVLTGSLVSACLGCGLLALFLPRAERVRT